MNPDLDRLQPYPFEKLNALKAAVNAPTELEHIALSIGEPRHPAPEFVLEVLANQLNKVSNYPTTKGLPELNEAIAAWCERRFHLTPNTLTGKDHVLPVNGTREAIFAFTQALISRQPNARVASPNPFYQIYEGAAYLAGAEPYFMPCLAENGFIPDFDAVPASVWQDTQLLFLCSPGNPTGAVIGMDVLKKLIALSDQYDFVIASDECYSEIYFDEANPPAGLLQACAELGRDDYKNCVVFHSLSKRSNLPGMRSGFIAGDAALMQPFLLYRTYHGCSMPIQHQLASIAAWQDESHTIANRLVYKEKFERVGEILAPVLNFTQPEASFYLWPETPINEEDFAQQLFAQQNVTVLPGSYLSRTVNGINPGQNRVRMALVATTEECVEAAQRIRRFVESL
ncbi:succinyldiaminopimelate aminotransferase apoenzyme [Oceanospirillum multiglobuliferum]|uniref:Succinyldiaminopimelate transaminase n=1 Tax=Oceanospirillum multiglobuliferum TaxID=64969 RepID=A0A1T4LTD8_9GAMM|nr:succinyldiaminopimelate transaminase [Oceanospirillum multiglobuliferum]OPX56365.1 succinyldiaminopimelate transaminase [Oceanospirillum multiglobuliferum]SJZ57972.1 succinyldiaminopimelate aminotransferase apoenzyme [Oceanospirillum multiglobuliferum]